MTRHRATALVLHRGHNVPVQSQMCPTGVISDSLTRKEHEPNGRAAHIGHRGLGLENAVREARDAGLEVYVCAESAEVREILERLEDLTREGIHMCETRLEALERAVGSPAA